MSTTTCTESNPRKVMIIISDENVLQQIQSTISPSAFQTIILDESNSALIEQRASSSVDDKQSKKKSLICVVCGAGAHGRNFGVIACESCKLFFRRNGLRDPKSLSCYRNDQCEIKVETRRRCLACRLTKCLNSGMKRDRLLKAEEKAARNSKTIDEVPIAVDMEVIEPAVHQSLLSAEDLERIEHVRMSFESRIELASNDNLQLMSPILANNLTEHLNTHSITAIRLLAFFKQIPEFNQLNVDDRMVLIKYNLMLVIAFNYTFTIKKLADNIIQVDTNVPWNESLIESVHGSETYSELQKLFQPIVQLATYDDKIIPLMLMTFILLKGVLPQGGTPEPILQDTMSVHYAQSFYTELLWKYLETAYGFDEAVRIMSTITTRFTSWQLLHMKIRQNFRANLSDADIDGLSPLMKSLFNVPQNT